MNSEFFITAAHFFLDTPPAHGNADDYCIAYGDIFYNTCGWNVPLWASSYKNSDARLLDGRLLDGRLLDANTLSISAL
jgi:hypothetical protein